MNSQGVGTNPFNSWYRSSDKEIFPEEEKQKIEDFVDMVYEDIEKATGIQFMNNEGSALYK
jgi:glutathionyl-hydroquinone reductase